MIDLLPQMRSALFELRLARDYALDMGRDPWQFAVEIDRFLRTGITVSDLRWLIAKGYVEHAEEITGPEDHARRFTPRKNLAFAEKSCLILAESSLSLFEDDVKGRLRETTENLPANAFSPTRSKSVPYWDVDDRTLFLGRLVVKEYRVRSPNQEAVLSAFEEENWPRYIDDPLPPLGDQNPKQRLRDTIKCLNANQKNRLIRFRGDGTGERVRWELIALQASN